mgnify:CR=1 FL=1
MDIKQFDSRFKVLPIKKIVKENDTTKTFIFDYSIGGKPGQFIMLWIPGVDEKPMSIAYDDGKELWITVCKVGPTSEALHKMDVGDKIGLRGPLGTHYEFKEGSHLALVSGGYGAAPMYFVTREALKKNCKVEFLVGARNEGLLLYLDKVAKLEGDVNIHISTDDGSKGHKGYVTEVLKDVLEKNKIDEVFTCGPEIMMQVVGQISEEAGINAEMSMEKYMKCGIGVCGQCAIDDTGDLVCTKGPVMRWKYLKELPEMGKYHRDAQGKKHYF